MEMMERMIMMMETKMVKLDEVVNQHMNSIMQIQLAQAEQGQQLRQQLELQLQQKQHMDHRQDSVDWPDRQLKQLLKQQQQMDHQLQQQLVDVIDQPAQRERGYFKELKKQQQQLEQQLSQKQHMDQLQQQMQPQEQQF